MRQFSLNLYALLYDCWNRCCCVLQFRTLDCSWNMLVVLDFYDWVVMVVGKKGIEGVEGSGEASSSCKG